jgi:hypothetical protein
VVYGWLMRSLRLRELEQRAFICTVSMAGGCDYCVVCFEGTTIAVGSFTVFTFCECLQDWSQGFQLSMAVCCYLCI